MKVCETKGMVEVAGVEPASSTWAAGPQWFPVSSSPDNIISNCLKVTY